MKKLSENIIFLIKKAGISANELAHNTGVPQPVIHRLIKCKTENPSIQTLLAIARYFSISVSQLIGDEPILNSNKKNRGGHKVIKNIPVIHWCDMKKWLKSGDEVQICAIIPIEKNIRQKTFALKIKELNSNITDDRFDENTIIIVDPTIESRNRDYVIVDCVDEHDFQPILRQLLMDGSQKYLRPLNIEAKTKSLQKNEKIIGVVIEVRQNYVDLEDR